MASKIKTDKKPPVMSANFRMAVEKMITKFVDSSSEVLEFPSTLTREQREFIDNYAFTSHGLKSRIIGKGLGLHVVVSKENENLWIASNCVLKLRMESLRIANKILDISNDSPSMNPLMGRPENDSNVKELPLNLVFIGSFSQNRKDYANFTVPPKNWNPICAEAREKLPIFKHRREILNMYNSSQVMIVESNTGSGKSTQIPQYILEQASENKLPCRIIVAEPKRLCATTLAGRVSFERGEMIGSTVGYQIRLESKVSPTSNLIYVTNGVILRMLMSGKPEEFFNGITTLIIDEVHERDKFSDFVLLCARKFMSLNENLKVIIMSATIQSETFSQYFNGCPVFKLEGRSFEVKENFLEDVLSLINFTNLQTSELFKSCDNNPELMKPPVKNSNGEIDLDDDTRITVNEILDKIASSFDSEIEFHSFSYMVHAYGVPIDIRHLKTNRTALSFAVEFGLKDEVKNLLNLKADPKLKFKIDGKEMTALDLALAKKHSEIASILEKNTELVSSSNNAIETSIFNRIILDIYYDTLVQPGVNRGVFLEDVVDLNLIAYLVRHIHFHTHTCNGILIFLPGHNEIVQLANLICNLLDTNFNIFILHSQLNTSDQTTVFERMPDGIRKIIIATNIAESSITINDVVYVIDSGRVNQKSFNAVTHVSSLRHQWISKASAMQRMGRAGRLCKGIVFRMYSRDRFNHLCDEIKPQILLCDLTDICLQSKMIIGSDASIAEFLKQAMTPPTDVALEHSIKILQQLGALKYDETLTRLGIYVADIPLNAKYGKMLIYGILFKCIDPVLTIVSILSIDDPFVFSNKMEDRQKCHDLKLKLEDQSYSDHFVMLKIFQKWNQYKTSHDFDGGFCEDNFVNSGTMERITSLRTRIVGYLRSIRLIESVGNLSMLNKNSHSWSMVKACIAAGSYPEVARILKTKGEIVTAVDKQLIINHRSVLRAGNSIKLTKDQLSHFPADWIIFEEKNLVGNVGMVKICSVISNFTIALTAGLGLSINDDRWSDDGCGDKDSMVELEVDNFIKFTTDSTSASVLLEIRQKIGILMDKFLGNVEKFRFDESDEILVEGIVKLLELQDEKAGFKIRYEGIGSRPRIVTREYNAPNEQQSAKPMPKPEEKEDFYTKIQKVQWQNSRMRYFSVELKSEALIKELKAKILVMMESEAKLPGDFLDALVELEVNDRITTKVILFYSDTQIVGVGMLTDYREKQIKRDMMKMFFQSEQRIDLSKLKSFVEKTEHSFEKLFSKPFAEIPADVGRFCITYCMNKPFGK